MKTTGHPPPPNSNGKRAFLAAVNSATSWDLWALHVSPKFHCDGLTPARCKSYLVLGVAKNNNNILDTPPVLIYISRD